MTYPQNDFIEMAAALGARVAYVAPDSPAFRAGLLPDALVLSVDGHPLRDILDWYWLADELEVELEVLQNGAAGEKEKPEYIALQRNPGEGWGIEFATVLFDALQSCVNKCSFCFMRMLPKGMRPALSVRDDDYRLSFLQGNFVTLTNLSDEDIERIVELHLSPLNVSLHAISSDVRTKMMGKNHLRGIEALEQLLSAGIEFRAQIVLMPGVNDGAELDNTLSWILARPGITATGIVPYGYTHHAAIQRGFDTKESAREVIKQIAHLAPRVQLADEFFVKAWPGEVLKHLPVEDYYDGFSLREDGIGMLRSFVESDAATALRLQSGSLLITGEAFADVLRELLPNQAQQVLAIKNAFFGGNVDVAGLLTAEDVIAQAREHIEGVSQLILPSVMFNDDGLTLDDKTAVNIGEALSIEIKVLDSAL